MKFLHLSDLHFHGEKKKNKKVMECLKFVKEKYDDHYLIVTGDITDDGTQGQYEHALQALKPFKGKVFICPGNHDFGAAGNLYSKEKARRFDDMLCDELDQGTGFARNNSPVVNRVSDGNVNCLLFALDTNLETFLPFDTACGEVGKKQLRELDNLLAMHSDSQARKIVFFHHHPLLHFDPFLRLRDAKKLVRVLYGRVDVVLFGHKHKAGHWQGSLEIPHMLAADNSPDNSTAKSVEISPTSIKVHDVPIR